MMSENSLTSSFAKKEVSYADRTKKRIVPVILDGDELRGWFAFDLGDIDYIVASDPDDISKLIRNLKSWLRMEDIGSPCPEMTRFSLPASTVSSSHPVNEVNLKVLSNLDCKVLIDSEEKTVAPADRLTKIPLPVGEYYAEFISTENSSDAISYEIILEHDKLEKIDLLSLKQTREKAEAEQEKARLEQDRLRIESMTLVPYISNNKVGFADLETREIIIPCRYDFVNAFSDGLAQVIINDKYGFIDKSGREVIPCRYDWANDLIPGFKNGLAQLRLNDKQGYVDRFGNEMWLEE